MREATSTSSRSRVVLTIAVCHTVWQIQAVEVSGHNTNRYPTIIGPPMNLG